MNQLSFILVIAALIIFIIAACLPGPMVATYQGRLISAGLACLAGAQVLAGRS